MSEWAQWLSKNGQKLSNSVFLGMKSVVFQFFTFYLLN